MLPIPTMHQLFVMEQRESIPHSLFIVCWDAGNTEYEPADKEIEQWARMKTLPPLLRNQVRAHILGKPVPHMTGQVFKTIQDLNPAQRKELLSMFCFECSDPKASCSCQG